LIDNGTTIYSNRLWARWQGYHYCNFQRPDDEEIVIRLPSMVSEWLKLRLDRDICSEFKDTVITHLCNYIELEEDNFEFSERQQVSPHLNVISQHIDYIEDRCDVFRAYLTFGSFCMNCSQYNESERWMNRALIGYEKALGSEHTSTLNMLNNLGVLYWKQGRLVDAEKMYDRALARREKALGPEHSSIFQTVNNLVPVYWEQGRLDDAEKMYHRALAGCERALGSVHTLTLDTDNNISVLYWKQGHLSDAEKMYGCALAGMEKILRPSTPPPSKQSTI
jgi:tetratricopeptide (TPR) repeat protein